MRTPVHWAKTQKFLVRMYIFMSKCEVLHGNYLRSSRHTLKSEVLKENEGVVANGICTTGNMAPFEHWLHS